MIQELQFSQPGLRRALQMTSATVTLFVEGFLDRPFISQIFEACGICDSKNVMVRLAKEVNPDRGSGKTSLLAQHEYLTGTNSLVIDRGTDKHISIFFLDKDIDDVSQTLVECPHVIYTEHYGLENYLYLHGNLVQALCCGAALDTNSVKLADNKTWTETAIQSWKDWVALCLLMRKAAPGMGPNYSISESPIHNGPYGTVNSTTETTFISRLAGKAGCSNDTILTEYENWKQVVSVAIQEGRGNHFFNGKWYGAFLVGDAKRIAAGRDLPSGFENRLESILLSSLKYDEPWTSTLCSKIKNLF